MTPPFRYRRLAYAALNVTDLQRSIGFYRDILGLALVASTDDVAYFRCSADHHNLVLHKSAERGLGRVAFELASAGDVDAAFAHFADLGLHPEPVALAEVAPLLQGPTFRVREKNCGLLFEFFSSIAQEKNPFTPTVAAILRLGHVVIGTTEFDATRNTLIDSFGFRVSDFVEGRFAFLRCFPNPYHHTLALGHSATNHLHHVSFMVAEVDDIGRALHRLKRHDIKVVFGPGRHPPSGSVFLYFLDPDGMTVEYSFGMEEFPELGARAPRKLEPVPTSLDTWGAVPDELFGNSGPIEVTR